MHNFNKVNKGEKTMNKKDLYIDFDGVIMDTIDITYQEIEKMGIKDDFDAVSEYYRSIDWFDLLGKVGPINDSLNCIKKLIASKLFNISILTHVNSVSEIEAKVNFIRKHLQDIKIISVPKTISKTRMVKIKDSILIDDYMTNIQEWEDAGGIGIVFSKKSNGRGFLVINKLDQILSDEFKEKLDLVINI